MNPTAAGVDVLVTDGAWWSRIFAAIDSANAEGFAGFLTDGAAAAEFGPGLIAEDLPDLVPPALRRVWGV